MPYVPPSPDAGWVDLAQNRPGESLRRAADERRQAAPLKSLQGRLFGMNTADAPFRIGAAGEEAVGAELAKLGLGYYALHSVPIGTGDSDVDHVVVGPKGVFVLNTKNHPGGKVVVGERVIWVNGETSDYLRNSRYEAKRASKLLSDATGLEIQTKPVIVVAGGDLSFKGASGPADVQVTNLKGLNKLLKAGRAVYDVSRVEQIFASARRSTTWQPGKRPGKSGE